MFMKVSGMKDTIDWYDSNAEAYAENTNAITFETIASEFLQRLQSHPKILDAGCGSGRDTKTLSELGANVIGMDISKGLIAVAKRNSPKIEFVVGNFLAIPFPDSTFDGIWSHASLVHLETEVEVQRVLSEFSRVLCSGGYLYLSVKKQTGHEKTAIVTDTLSNHERFFRYYSEEELKTLLQESYFTLEELIVVDDPHGREEVKWIRVFAKKN